MGDARRRRHARSALCAPRVRFVVSHAALAPQAADRFRLHDPCIDRRHCAPRGQYSSERKFPGPNSSSANSMSTMTAAGGEESAHTTPDTGQAPAARLATRPSLPAVAETGAVVNACEQGSSFHRTWAYLEGKCVAGTARKPRAIRVETDRPPIAAIAIGRIAAPERAAEPASSAPGVLANPPKSAAAAPAEMAASTKPSSRPAAASKKPQKTARSQQRRREPGGTEAVGWREVRTDDWAARGYGERDYGRGGFAREGAFGFFR